MANTLKKMKIVIIVLSILLGISLLTLAGVIIHSRNVLSDDLVVVENNVIEQTAHRNEVSNASSLAMLWLKAPDSDVFSFNPLVQLAKTYVDTDRVAQTTISLYRNHADETSPFHVENMFPGDSVTMRYNVEVSHNDPIIVYFNTEVKEGYEKLAEVLKCKIVVSKINPYVPDEGKLVYDGLMRDMPEDVEYLITEYGRNTTQLAYDITVYLDTSVGNEYMNKELLADFEWWVMQLGSDKPDPPTPPGPGDDDDDDDDDGDIIVEPEDPEEGRLDIEEETILPNGHLIYPQWMINTFAFCILLLLVIIALIIIKLTKKRKNICSEEGERSDEE